MTITKEQAKKAFIRYMTGVSDNDVQDYDTLASYLVALKHEENIGAVYIELSDYLSKDSFVGESAWCEHFNIQIE